MLGGDKFTRKRVVKKQIPTESKKRKKEHKTYLQRLKERWDKSVEEGTNKCFFCDEVMLKREANHHVRGRGKFMLEEEFWVWAHHDCHLDYHFKPIEELMKEPWYSGFMERLHDFDAHSYFKQKKKEEKNEELFD